MIDLTTKITKKEAIQRLYANSNIAQLGRDFERLFQSESFKNLDCAQKKSEIDYHNYTLLSVIFEGKKEFNKEIESLVKRYL